MFTYLFNLLGYTLLLISKTSSASRHNQHQIFPNSMRCFFHKTLVHISPLHPTKSTTNSHSLTRTKSNRVRSMSTGSTHRMFQLKLDPLTGNSEWVVIEEDEAPENSPKPLLATTSYLDMLNDSHRNRAFRVAIDKTITKPCHVLDIG